MAEIKNFGLTGVGSDVQLGKAGPRLKVNAGVVEATNTAGDGLVIVRAANAVSASDVVTLAQLNNVAVTLANSISNAVASQDGFHIIMGNVAVNGDGSWTPGAVSVTDTTPVSEAFDRLNEIVGLLTPAAPPAFPNANALTVTNTAGSTPLLASGVTDNSGTSTITAGQSVTRTVANVNSNTFNDMGDGSTGTVQLLINGTIVGSKTLTGSGDNTSNAGLVIADQKDYPVATPGFYKSIDVSVSNAVTLTGVNKFKLNHTAAGSTSDVYFVRDSLNTVPTVSITSVAQANAGTVAYSSSVPHYNTGASLTFNATITNLAGQTYYGGSDPLVISGTNSIFSSATKTYANLGITTPIAQNTTTATAISAQTITVNPTNVHNIGVVQAVGKNVVGSSATASNGTNILVKNGTAGSRIDEMSVTVSGLGSSPNSNNAIRVSTATGDTPSAAVGTWTQSAALASWDAAVVGGVLAHNLIDYSNGSYLPVGPDLSGRDASQYVVFSFNRTALSQFKINVTGTYSGVWIKLPGVSTAQPNAAGGWWNAYKLYDGAGIPGETGDTDAGCASGAAMNGTSGTFSITFGTASSTSATGNQILVRFKLLAGQSITALSFTN